MQIYAVASDSSRVKIPGLVQCDEDKAILNKQCNSGFNVSTVHVLILLTGLSAACLCSSQYPAHTMTESVKRIRLSSVHCSREGVGGGCFWGKSHILL